MTKPLDLEGVKTKVLEEFVELTFGTDKPIELLLKTLDNKDNVFTQRETLALFLDLFNNVMDEIKQRIKSACEFYLKYENKPTLLWRERKELVKKHRKFLSDLDDYNKWLFKLAFSRTQDN